MTIFYRLAACVLLVALASSCSDRSVTGTEAATSTAPTAPDGQTMPASEIEPEHQAELKGFIASSGGDCADIVSVRGEDLSNKVKVTCTAPAGAEGTVTYTVDLETEKAQKDG